MTQANLYDFDTVVKPEIERNQYPRINWKAILNGHSLTQACARFRAAGLGAELTYKTLVYEHPELSSEALRRLKIGVCARFGETSTALKELKKVK